MQQVMLDWCSEWPLLTFFDLLILKNVQHFFFKIAYYQKVYNDEVQVDNYEIVINFFHISYNLT